MMMPTVLRAALRGLALGGVVTLAACNGVGKGISPTSAVLLPAGGAEGDTTLTAHTCLNTSLTLIVDFSNGARGDFTSRAKWSSNRPDVVNVSNGEIAVPDQDGFFYGRGVLVPLKEGTARITATYLDFSKSIDVTVTDPANFVISPADANLAIGSSLDLGLTAELDGVKSAVDGFVRWSFVETSEVSGPIASINAASGLVAAVGTNSTATRTLTARAKIPGCSLTAATVTVPVNISPLNSLALTREFSSGSGQLVVGTTERITATGTLANGKTQDLSGQVIFTSLQPDDGDATTARAASDLATFLAGSLRNLIYSAKVGANGITSAELNASFSYTISDGDSSTTDPTSTPIVASPLTVTPVAATLMNVMLSPTQTALKLAPRNSLLLKAFGEYQTTTTPVTTFEQDITRHVTWSVPTADLTTLTVQSSASGVINPLAGFVLANAKAETGKMVVVNATNNDASGNKTATSTITIDPTEPQAP